MKPIIAFVAKIFYSDDYLLMKEELIKLNNRVIDINTEHNLDIVVALLILGEDHRFDKHIGFDIIGIIRAIRNKLFYNKTEGASTIEQQLVRILIDDFSITFKRKVKEIFLATIVTEFIPKNKIPISYLYIAHYGTNIDGIKKILSKFNFDLKDKVNVNIAAEIVARIKYPETKTPKTERISKIKNRKQHLISLYKSYLYKNCSNEK